MGSVWASLRSPAMRMVGLVFLAECAWWPILGAAQDVDHDLLRLCSPPVREPGAGGGAVIPWTPSAAATPTPRALVSP